MNRAEFAAEIERLADHHSAFEQEMAKRLRKKAEKGWRGWDDRQMIERLKDKLAENIQQGDWVDVANLAGFLHDMDASGIDMQM